MIARTMGIPGAGNDFYARLEQDRDWWQANRAAYEADVKGPLRALLEEGAERFGGTIKIFRPHNDVRFSKKGPLKTEAVGGLGDESTPSVLYVRINADGTFVGGGAPAPVPPRLLAIRERIAADPRAAGDLRSALAELSADGFDVPDDPLKTAPRGFDRDHDEIDLLRRRWYRAERQFPPGALAGEDGAEEVFAVWKRLDPLIDWLEVTAQSSSSS